MRMCFQTGLCEHVVQSPLLVLWWECPSLRDRFFKDILFSAHIISLETESQDNLMSVKKLRIISKNTVQKKIKISYIHLKCSCQLSHLTLCALLTFHLFHVLNEAVNIVIFSSSILLSLINIFSCCLFRLSQMSCQRFKLSAARSVVELCAVIPVIFPSPDNLPSHKPVSASYS